MIEQSTKPNRSTNIKSSKRLCMVFNCSLCWQTLIAYRHFSFTISFYHLPFTRNQLLFLFTNILQSSLYSYYRSFSQHHGAVTKWKFNFYSEVRHFHVVDFDGRIGTVENSLKVKMLSECNCSYMSHPTKRTGVCTLKVKGLVVRATAQFRFNSNTRVCHYATFNKVYF